MERSSKALGSYARDLFLLYLIPLFVDRLSTYDAVILSCILIDVEGAQHNHLSRSSQDHLNKTVLWSEKGIHTTCPCLSNYVKIEFAFAICKLEV